MFIFFQSLLGKNNLVLMAFPQPEDSKFAPVFEGLYPLLLLFPLNSILTHISYDGLTLFVYLKQNLVYPCLPAL